MRYEPIPELPKFKVSTKSLSFDQTFAMVYQYVSRTHPYIESDYVTLVASNIADRLRRYDSIHNAVGFHNGVPKVLYKYDHWDRFSSYKTVNVNSFNKIFNFK